MTYYDAVYILLIKEISCGCVFVAVTFRRTYRKFFFYFLRICIYKYILLILVGQEVKSKQQQILKKQMGTLPILPKNKYVKTVNFFSVL